MSSARTRKSGETGSLFLLHVGDLARPNAMKPGTIVAYPFANECPLDARVVVDATIAVNNAVERYTGFLGLKNHTE